MNSSNFNAMAGALLAVVFVVMTVSIASDAIFHSAAPETEGYALEAGDGTAPAVTAKSSDGIEPIAPLLASADIDNGIKAFKKCAACHTVEEGGANKVGPNLWNIVNRTVATAPDFGYSTAMTEYADGGANSWTYAHLNGFLAAPKKFIKGTAMGFAGLKKTQDRADIIAYLRTLSASPAPLPADEAPEAAAVTDTTSTDTGADTGTDSGTDTGVEAETAPAATTE